MLLFRGASQLSCVRQAFSFFDSRASITARALGLCTVVSLSSGLNGIANANHSSSTLPVVGPIISCDKGLLANGPSEGRLPVKAISVRLPFLTEPSQDRWVENFIDPKRVPGSQAEPKGDEKLIVVDDDPYLRSTILTALPEYLPGAKGLFVMLPGMGGMADQYGVRATTRPFASTVLSRGYFPIALQNWVYYGTGHLKLPLEEREAIAERFSDLSTQQRALANFYNSLSANTPEWQRMRPHEIARPIYVATRSHGTGESLQMVSDAARGNETSRGALRNVPAVVISGLNSPEPAFMARWTAAEDREKPGVLDSLAIKTDRRLYNQMTFMNPAPPGTEQYSDVPAVIAIIAARDEYVSVEDQVAMMEKFSALHPTVRVLLVFTDVVHDPMRSILYHYQSPDMAAPKRVKVGTGQRFWQVVERALVGGENADGKFEPLLPQLVPGKVARFEFPEYRLCLHHRVADPPKPDKE